jgi:uncharacterized protein (DUF885 family)
MSRLEELTQRYWDAYLAANPTTATLYGDRRFDHLLEDLSSQHLEAVATDLKAVVEEATAIDPVGLDIQEGITREMLISEAGNQVTLIETSVLISPCDPMLGPVFGLIQATAQTQAENPDQAQALMERYRQVPRLLDQALERHRVEAGAGRTPVARNVARVISQIDDYLQTPPEADPFAQLPGPEGWQGYRTWREQLVDLAADQIRPAFSSYREGVRDLLELSRGDGQPGLCHLAEGDVIYRRLIEVFTGLPLEAPDLHQIGLEEATGTLAAEFGVLGEQVFGVDDPGAVMARLRTDLSLRYLSSEEILAHATEIVSRAWEASEPWFNLRPIGTCLVQPVPEALERNAPPAYYLPPAGDGSRPGIYFINTHQPQERARYAAEATAFHEASPGHHFQLTLASELSGIPEFRKRSLTTAYVEGWGLYAERLADEMGLYTSPLEKLGMVSAEAWRAGRLVVDTGLHALGWTREQAIDFLTNWTALDPETISVEVDRYIGVPAQALAYKVGQREILRLRRLAQDRIGAGFDIRDFHDAVLGSGPLPLGVLESVVENWIADPKTGASSPGPGLWSPLADS